MKAVKQNYPIRRLNGLREGIGKSSSHKQYDIHFAARDLLSFCNLAKIDWNEPNILSTIAKLHNQHRYYNISPRLYSAFIEEHY